jgi:hypothetical protein
MAARPRRRLRCAPASRCRWPPPMPHMQRNPARLHRSLGHRKGRVEYRRLPHGPSRRLRSPPPLPLVRFHCLPRQHGTVMMVKTQPPSHARPVQRQPQTVPFASVAAAGVAGAVRTRGVRPVTPGCLRCPVRRTLGRTLFVAVRQYTLRVPLLRAPTEGGVRGTPQGG